MQELIGYYIPMEEYYMRESVNKVHFSVYCNAHVGGYVHFYKEKKRTNCFILCVSLLFISFYFSLSNKFNNHIYTSQSK